MNIARIAESLNSKFDGASIKFRALVGTVVSDQGVQREIFQTFGRQGIGDTDMVCVFRQGKFREIRRDWGGRENRDAIHTFTGEDIEPLLGHLTAGIRLPVPVTQPEPALALALA